MTFSFLQIALVCLTYLTVLFSIAYSTEKGWIPNRLITHPVTYILSLGIFASAWSFYGVIELARQYGYGALAYYLGTGALFLFAPVALKPLMELARRFQINSMADLLVFRYHSHAVGGAVTLCMLLAMLPLLALQVQAVGDTIHLMTSTEYVYLSGTHSRFGTRELTALLYCCAIVFFAMLFGANREHHKGLITVMAFESLVKLFGLLAVGAFVIFQIFGGMAGLDTWLAANPEHLDMLHRPVRGSSHTLLLVFIATAVAMPHIFHITVVENPTKHASSTLTWAFPLFLLLMALPIFPLLWAGFALDIQIPATYFPLAVPLASNNVAMSIIAFVGGLSAATGAMIAIALAMSTMVLNHWILPATSLRTKSDIYRQLIWMRRLLVAAVVLAGYLFYLLLNGRFNLTELALTAFIGTLQFLPGIIAVAHWSRGNRRGLLAGLAAGTSVWLLGMVWPMVSGISQYHIIGLDQAVPVGPDQWSQVTLWSLGLNTVFFVWASLVFKQSDEERYSAELCSEDELSHPIRLTLDVRSPEEIVERLSRHIGASTARTEVERALHTLGLHPNESRPYALRRLRDEVEANLSGLMGMSVASEILDRLIPYKVPESLGATDINLIENRLTQVRNQLTGLAAELNNLRLYHRRTLEELPLATCSIGQDMEILMWNSAMTNLTGIDSEVVTGSHLEDVAAPWGELLTAFSQSSQPRFYKQPVILNERPHWITLHKATIPSSFAHRVDGQVILLEDVTELQMLEQELVHSERLASVGRLSAGIAHEIGNPVTGIACLAQNMRFETENPEVLESVEQILSQTDRVSRIVQSLVSFSHSGQQPQDALTLTSLHECAQEAINLLALQKEHKVHFSNQLDPDLHAPGDPQRLIQVFINLLSNARDASPAGSEVIIDGNESVRCVTFRVTDSGPGIPPEHQARIFEPFFTTKEPGEGTGLGLAMVYSIIEEHTGDLTINSPVDADSGRGTQFVIRLPRQT